MNEFKKVFNKTKLNAPVNGDEDYEVENEPEVVEDKKFVNKKKFETKKNLIDFGNLEAFSGQPNVNDQIAFQVYCLVTVQSEKKYIYFFLKILEISSNFTPEISDYKTGVVLSFDAKTNEVSLKLDGSSYNAGNKKNYFYWGFS
jgi:hypothetical protein